MYETAKMNLVKYLSSNDNLYSAISIYIPILLYKRIKVVIGKKVFVKIYLFECEYQPKVGSFLDKYMVL